MFEVSAATSPIPKTIRPESAIRRKYPFDQMDVGQHFFVPEKTKNTLATHASLIGRRMHRKFVTRMCYMKKTKSGWVACDASDKNAVYGIGCWRTA